MLLNFVVVLIVKKIWLVKKHVLVKFTIELKKILKNDILIIGSDIYDK
jgi:hypothetical protein